MKNLENLKKYIPYAIIAIALALAIASMKNDSLVVDEIPHIGAGYSYVVKHDMRLNPEHPPLVKDLAGLGLSLLKPNQDAFKSKFWQTDINGQWEFGRLLIFNTGNDADSILYAVRLPILIFFILSSWLVFYWGRKLYGETAGVIALILFSFSPTIMAHARLVTTDMAALFGILSATYFFLIYLRESTKKNFFFAAIVFGIALLCKFSTALLVPYLGLTALIWGFLQPRRFSDRILHAINYGFRSVAVFAVGFLLIVWPVYILHTAGYPPERQVRDTRQDLSTDKKRWIAEPIIAMADKPIIRAAGQYLLGFAMVQQRATGGNEIFYLGNTVNDGGPWYFPIVYFLKEPLAWWGFVIMALVVAILWQRGEHHKKLGIWLKDNFESVAMILWLVVYWSVSISSNLNIGIRHLLPTFPFAILLVSSQVGHLLEKSKHLSREHMKITAGLVSVLIAWYVYENVSVFPNYLTYFNQIAGGPSGGYRYVVDSNLDWGQDVKRLAQWTQKNDIKKISLDYFGWTDASYYLGDKFIWTSSSTFKDSYDFIKNNQSNSWIAVSATFLQNSNGQRPDGTNSRNNYLWLDSFEPVTVIGNSIFVWHIGK